ncbi:MAG: LPS export ABC transporter permease LptF [Proteobacteria bacterium]|nr:LPS export ABC transporter permease LptF [Pseudomonadota bacterium]
MLTILQKYLFREWLVTFLAITVVLMMVMLGVLLGNLLGDVADGSLPATLLGKQLLYQIPEALSMIIPLSLFLGVMFGLGRLYRDNEMAVMWATGFRQRDLIKPLMLLVLPLFALLLFDGLVLLSGAARASDAAIDKAYKSAVLWGLRPATFHSLSKGNLVVYIESMGEDGNLLNNVFLLNRVSASRDGKASREQTWFAKDGRFWVEKATGKRFIELRDGEIIDRDPLTRELKKLSFERAQLIIPESEKKAKKDNTRRLTTMALLASSKNIDKAELQWRGTSALMALLMVILAIPLSHVAPRDSRSGRVVIGLLVYVMYINLLTVARGWLAVGKLPALLGLWWVHAIFFLLAAIWIWLQRRRM